MATASRMKRRGAIASKRTSGPVTSMSYPSFTANVTPTGIIPVAMTNNAFRAGQTIYVTPASVLSEPESALSNGSYYSFAVFPEEMAAGPYWVKVRHGGRSSSTDRAYGCGYASADGSTAVFCLFYASSNSSRIYTWSGGAMTSRATSSAFSGSSSDDMDLRYALSGADIVYTAYKNDVATSLTWTDTNAATFGTPGRRPLVAFRHQYSSSQYYSPGVKAISAGMI